METMENGSENKEKGEWGGGEHSERGNWKLCHCCALNNKQAVVTAMTVICRGSGLKHGDMGRERVRGGET